MTKKQKKIRNRLILVAIIYFPLLLLDKLGVYEHVSGIWLPIVLYLIPYVLVSYDVFIHAFKNIGHGRFLDERFLMCIATVAAFCTGECSEGVAAMLFYQVGELFESYAVNRSRESIKDLMSIAPEYANVEVDGKLEQVDPDDVEIGTVIVIKPGEKVPLDGIVVKGTSLLDTAALTGESVKRTVNVGDEIFSGCINTSGLLHVQTTKEFDDCTVAKILELVENASSQKAYVENFITKFAKYYTPAVVIIAAALAVFGSIFMSGGVSEAIQRACIFLVVSCPCALVISVPLSFFGGIGAASRRGILVKGSNFLEAMAKTDTIVFDKTGTLTQGCFEVQKVWPEEQKDTVLKYAALCEGFSNHPISISIREAYEGDVDLEQISENEEIAGSGVKIMIDGVAYYAGNEKLMRDNSISYTPCTEVGTIVYVARENEFLGWVLIADSIKEGTKTALEHLHSLGVNRTVMLTGDRKEVAESVAEQVGIDLVYSQLLPGDKVDQVQKLLSEETDGRKLAFVGDGINDAPVIMRSDVGIAMGSMGSDAAIEAADVVLMDDDIDKIATIIRISRKTLRIARANIVFALTVKLLVLLLGAVGIANMWLAIFADVGVAVLAILNAMRTLRIK